MPDATILATYERGLRSLLWRLRPPRLQRGVNFLVRRALTLAGSGQDSPSTLQLSYERYRSQTIRHLLRWHARRRVTATTRQETAHRATRQMAELLERAIAIRPDTTSADFHCDSGLGGLARWLRAAGYDARFWPEIEDAQLIEETIGTSAILLTTDTPMMNRGPIKWQLVPSLLVPLPVGKLAQFQFVCEQLSLAAKDPRCMSCGGGLLLVDKETVRERIPPRTYPWLDEFFQCARCEKLFWRGTHWQNVEQRLRQTTTSHSGRFGPT